MKSLSEESSFELTDAVNVDGKTESESLNQRIYSCWLGKAIGGTLGGPHEGKRGPLRLGFYEPVPREMQANDDLDLQLVWMHHLLETRSSEVTPELLIQAWQKHVRFPFDEYGICLRNFAYDLQGSKLGAFDNWFSECMGAAIRSELWACVSPGDPDRAAGFAWADAVCDHAGDGVWAEVFLSALESYAFIESDRERLLDRAIGYLPSTSRIRHSVTDTRKWWKQTRNWLMVRNDIVAIHGRDNFTDVAANIAFIVLGWLAGEGDFGKSICIATNCGMDTDCTAATLGALLGILNPNAIPDAWKTPIGERIEISPEIVDINTPGTLRELTALTVRLQNQLGGANPVIGDVLPRSVATDCGSPIRIPVRITWHQDISEVASRSSNGGQDSHAELLPGHWIRRHYDEFLAPIMQLSFSFVLNESMPILICAWSKTRKLIWVDDVMVNNVDSNVYCDPGQFGAPSFHRFGPGIFKAETLSKGAHALRIAWDRPEKCGEAELVFGIANAQTKQWIEFAIAELK